MSQAVLTDMAAILNDQLIAGDLMTLPNNSITCGILDTNLRMVDAIGTVTGTAIVFTGLTADLSDVIVGDVVEVDSKVYSVAEIQPETAGITKLILTATE